MFSAKWMAFNLGLPEKAIDYKESSYSEVLSLYKDTGASGSWGGPVKDGGLETRIRRFGLFGDVSETERNRLIKEAFGLDPESDLIKLLLDEEVEWLEKVTDHVEKMEQSIAELADAAINDDAYYRYNEQMDELEETVATARNDILNEIERVMPERPESAQKCQ